MKRLAMGTFLVLAVGCGLAQAATLTVGGGGTYANLPEAVAAAAAGDLITVADGTYVQTAQINVGKSLTIQGASEAGVVIDCTAVTGYGFSVYAPDVTLENFTILAGTPNYPIHASGTTNPPDGFDNLTIRNLTVTGPHQRTGLDINGYNHVVLSHVTSSGATGGNGLQVSGCVDVTMDNITTGGNAWGSIAVYVSTQLGRGSADVAIDGATLDLGEDYLFIQDEAGFLNSNVTVTGWDLVVRNSRFREALGYADSDGYTFPRRDLAHAASLALAFTGYEASSTIAAVTGGAFFVVDGMAIQAAIDAAAPGDAITVGAGFYEEQLHIATDGLAIAGAGVGATVVAAPADLALSFVTAAYDNYPVVFVDGAAGTALSGLTIDGQGHGALNNRFCGLGLHNADGAYADLRVTGVREDPLNGNQHGLGLYFVNDDAAARSVALTDVAVDDIQKNAATFTGFGLDVSALRVSCTGSGPLGLGLPAQNGIQVSGGAFATLTDCAIADYDYTEPSWTATGLLVFEPSSVAVGGGTIDACKTSIYLIDASGTIDGVTVTNPVADPMYAYTTGTAKSAGRRALPPQAVDAPAFTGANKAAISVLLTNSTFIGTDTVDMWGPTAWAGDAVDFTVQGCTITHFDYGLNLYEDGGVVTGSASGNVLRDNLTYGAWSNTAVPYDARGNDWGDPSGPYHPALNPAGLGNAVSDNILFEPWTGEAALGVFPDAGGPLACGEDLDLTFRYTADEATPDLFLYNLVVRVSPELFFNSVTDDLPFGDLNNNFFVTNNLNGTWTFVGSTVGNPSSPVVGPGIVDLFTVHFRTEAEGTGAVTIESFALRDPANHPIAAATSGATVAIDCTAPAAVTGITAAPRHNKVDVGWTHDGVDVDHYEVFAGLWHDGSGASAYPEYDDLPGDVIPSRPGSYAAAVASAEWTDLGPFPVPGMTQAWPDAASRGVYYYEVFAVDAAGNASPAAAANDRATNYWLGDVYGTAPGDLVPNGLVDVRDINYLAPAVGLVLPDGDSRDVLDVGPTDDWSRVGIPLTDSRIDYEDVMVFSMNFGVVSAAKSGVPVSSKAVLAWVDYGDGRYGLRVVDAPSLKGVHVSAAVAVASVTAGDLLDQQGEPTLLVNPGERLDAVVAVMGVDNPFRGAGDLMVVTAKDAVAVADLVIDARAFDNSRLEVSLEQASGTLSPRVFALHAAYPNPFNPMTKISFSLPEAQAVKLTVYTVDGRRVATLVDEVRAAGLHEVIWNGADDAGRRAASGVYFYRIDAGPYSQVRKMTLMK